MYFYVTRFPILLGLLGGRKWIKKKQSEKSGITSLFRKQGSVLGWPWPQICWVF